MIITNLFNTKVFVDRMIKRFNHQRKGVRSEFCYIQKLQNVIANRRTFYPKLNVIIDAQKPINPVVPEWIHKYNRKICVFQHIFYSVIILLCDYYYSYDGFIPYLYPIIIFVSSEKTGNSHYFPLSQTVNPELFRTCFNAYVIRNYDMNCIIYNFKRRSKPSVNINL